jgi:starch phosphorylase
MLGVDMVISWDNPETNNLDLKAVHPFELKKEDGARLFFELKVAAAEAGIHKIGFRVYPLNPELPHRMDFSYVRWISF